MIHGSALTRFACGLTTFLLLLSVVRSQEQCSKTCVAQNCNALKIRYGKYCGIGYVGCPGEQPCDDLDTCCMHHDNCVTLKGMTYVNCHKQFQSCVIALRTSINQPNNQKVGFSKQCPYSIVIPTVYNGMDYGIFFSKIGNVITPKPPAKAKPVVEVDLARAKADTKGGLGTNKGVQTKQGSRVYAPMNPSPP